MNTNYSSPSAAYAPTHGGYPGSTPEPKPSSPCYACEWDLRSHQHTCEKGDPR